jgi:1-phosphofructokinase
MAGGAPPQGPAPGGTVTVLACAVTLMVGVEHPDGEAPGEVHLHAGGQAFWVARMAARLGARVTMVGPFGGESGTALRALIEAEGVGVRAIETCRPNAVWVSDDAEGESATVSEVAPPALSRHETDGLFNAVLGAGLESDVTVLTGAPPGVLGADRFGGVAHDLHAVGGRVMADLSGDQLQHALEGGLDLVKVAHDEMIEAGLADDDGPEALLAGARRMRERGAGAVLVSRAADPLLALVGDREVEVATPAFQPVNHRGAGDSMTGAAAAALAAGAEHDEVLRLAVAAGALNVTRRGLGSGDARAVRRLSERVELRPAGAA